MKMNDQSSHQSVVGKLACTGLGLAMVAVAAHTFSSRPAVQRAELEKKTLSNVAVSNVKVRSQSYLSVQEEFDLNRVNKVIASAKKADADLANMQSALIESKRQLKGLEPRLLKIDEARMKIGRILQGKGASEFIRRHRDEIEKLNREETKLANERLAVFDRLSATAAKK